MSKYNETRNCKGCMWYDTCDHKERCDDYYSPNCEEALVRSEYEADLKKRVDYYDKLVEEFNN